MSVHVGVGRVMCQRCFFVECSGRFTVVGMCAFAYTDTRPGRRDLSLLRAILFCQTSKLQGVIDFVPYLEHGDGDTTPPTLVASGSVTLSRELAASAFIVGTRDHRKVRGDAELNWCAKKLATSLRVPLLPDMRSSHRSSSSRRRGESSEVQVSVKWTPGNDPAATKFVGWVRVTLRGIDALAAELATLQKAVRVRTRGAGIKTLDVRQGRPGAAPTQSVATASTSLDGSFFAVDHHGVGVPAGMPNHVSPTSVAWPPGDPSQLQFLVMADTSSSSGSGAEKALVVELWGRRTASGFVNAAMLAQQSQQDPQPARIGDAGQANILLGIGTVDLSRVINPDNSSNSWSGTTSNKGGQNGLQQVHLQALDGTAACTCHAFVSCEPARPDEMGDALLMAATSPTKKGAGKQQGGPTTGGAAGLEALATASMGRGGGPFGIFKSAPGRLALLRRATAANAAAAGGGAVGTQFSLEHMRSRLQEVDPEKCLGHCLAVDKKRSGRIDACDFEVVLQRCGVALANAELAAL